METLLSHRLLAVLVLLPALALTGCDSGSQDDPSTEPPEPTFRIASVLQQGFNGGWQDGRNSVYTYDGQGLLTEIVSWSADSTSVLSREVYAYDGNGLLEEVQDFQYYEDGEIVTTAFYRYDAEERLAERRTTWLGGNSWETSRYRHLYTYDAQDLLERMDSELLQYGSEEWAAAGHVAYAYNPDATFHEVINYGMVAGVGGSDPELPYSRERYFHAAGTLDRVETDLWLEEAWMLINRTSYSYDENENIRERHTEVLGQDGSTLSQSRYLYTWELVENGEARGAARVPHLPGVQGLPGGAQPGPLVR